MRRCFIQLLVWRKQVEVPRVISFTHFFSGMFHDAISCVSARWPTRVLQPPTWLCAKLAPTLRVTSLSSGMPNTSSFSCSLLLLTLSRFGTCGTPNPEVPIGSFVVASGVCGSLVQRFLIGVLMEHSLRFWLTFQGSTMVLRNPNAFAAKVAFFFCFFFVVFER